ncbi:Biosynthetic Aromatic amino acid aminotransferase alpha [Mariniradius saccharolyticus AK6]|uniref:Aminotransferase n=1 Tax=Mariniradius saccharolyticus AK6 TaxID=1239962 RepID=M7XDB0_9BACT|nr:aminotransferase class I/II-fold pyridoxal phosphate-dependent enzyme [Mariniradius saccharolyticus]EMS35425.1 Biosynthetic Aromatic amino acid aminotransferase alpha [Mariniradius saccharolyticus AK6]
MKGYSKRLADVQEYYFSQKLREVAQLQAAGKPIINMGIGSPDLPPHPSVVEALAVSAGKPNSHGYQGYQGVPALRAGFADFYQRFYGVALNPNSEILPLMGSKEGIMHISMTFLDAGDEVLVPDPGYPTYRSVAALLGVKAVPYALKAEYAWRPDWKEIESRDLSKVKIMWANYPHMPTGARADLGVFEEIVAFGKKYGMLIVHDNPYSFVLEPKPKSILQVAGAMDVALELNSLSKTSNMAGWRVGMLAGKPEWIQAVTKVKSNMDSGMFLGIQQGAVAALGLGQDWYDALNRTYAERRRLIWELASKLGFSYEKESAGMFVWCKIQDGKSAEAWVDYLLHEKSIFVTPGTVFGIQGQGYIRFSLCVSEEKIKEAIDRI